MGPPWKLAEPKRVKWLVERAVQRLMVVRSQEKKLSPHPHWHRQGVVAASDKLDRLQVMARLLVMLPCKARRAKEQLLRQLRRQVARWRKYLKSALSQPSLRLNSIT